WRTGKPDYAEVSAREWQAARNGNKRRQWGAMIYPGEGKKGQPKAGDYVLAAERVRAETRACASYLWTPTGTQTPVGIGRRHHRSIAGRSSAAFAARSLRWGRPCSQQASYCRGRTRVLAARGTIGAALSGGYANAIASALAAAPSLAHRSCGGCAPAGERKGLRRVTRLQTVTVSWMVFNSSAPELEGNRGKSGLGPRGADSSKCNS